MKTLVYLVGVEIDGERYEYIQLYLPELQMVATNKSETDFDTLDVGILTEYRASTMGKNLDGYPYTLLGEF